MSDNPNFTSFGTEPGNYVMGMSTGPSPKTLTALRFFALFFSFLAFVVMASDKYHGYKFDEFHGFAYIVGSSFLLFFFSLIMFPWQLIKTCSSNKSWSRGLLYAQMLVDFLLVMLVFSAAVTGATTSTQNYKGVLSPVLVDNQITNQRSTAPCHAISIFEQANAAPGSSWFPKKYCVQASASVAMTFFASFFEIAVFWVVAGGYYSN